MNTSKKPRVNLIAVLESPEYPDLGPEEVSYYGALSCFEEATSLQLFLRDEKSLTKEALEKKKEKILDETSGRGHGSVLDQNAFTFVIEDIPRIVTLQLCLPQYLGHLQQSLRRAKADRGFYIPNAIRESRLFRESVNLLSETFSLYEEMIKVGIPGEDSRFILPLLTRTNIQTTGDARELMHLHHMSRQKHIPSIIKETLETMVQELKEDAPKLFKERKSNYEVLAWYPSSQLFTFKNDTMKDIVEKYGKSDVALISKADFPISEEGINKAIRKRDEAELANLKHIHYTFLANMSLACFHQATRQRTWDQSVESIYEAIERKEFITPHSINQNTKYLQKYNILNEKILDFYKKLLKEKIPQQEAVGIIPHSLSVYDSIHVNGWNAIHSIGKRTCTKAQWEIRGIAKSMAKIIQNNNPILGKYVQPQGVVYNKCPERDSCKLCDKILETFD